MKNLRNFLLFCLALFHSLWAYAGDTNARPTNAPASVELRDQFDSPRKLNFPAPKVTLLAIADKKGSREATTWMTALKSRYAGRVDIRGLANVGGVPGLLRERIRRKFREVQQHPVMMDWSGKVCARFGYQPGAANILVIDRNGRIRGRFEGAPSEPAIAAACRVLDAALAGARAPAPTNDASRFTPQKSSNVRPAGGI